MDINIPLFFLYKSAIIRQQTISLNLFVVDFYTDTIQALPSPVKSET